MFSHKSVMPNEVITLLSHPNPTVYVDYTSGGGGHAELFLNRYPNLKLVLMDRDADAIANLKAKFASERRVIPVHAKASEVDKVLFLLKIKKVDIIFGDLGVSSHQLDIAERGFSFNSDGPMDMRMDKRENYTALDLIKDLPMKELVSVLSTYGEERESKRVAAALKEGAEKGLTTTLEFSDAIIAAKRFNKGKIHPATKVFQALRIALNREMEEIELMLERGYDLLSEGGKMGFLTFHSLEDRRVKHFFKGKKHGDELGIVQAKDEVKVLKFVLPGKEEVGVNPRSRSAKLRVLEKIKEG